MRQPKSEIVSEIGIDACLSDDAQATLPLPSENHCCAEL